MILIFAAGIENLLSQITDAKKERVEVRHQRHDFRAETMQYT
jgi:hypothetical protein